MSLQRKINEVLLSRDDKNTPIRKAPAMTQELFNSYNIISLIRLVALKEGIDGMQAALCAVVVHTHCVATIVRPFRGCLVIQLHIFTHICRNTLDLVGAFCALYVKAHPT